jgi:hypothetical protein
MQSGTQLQHLYTPKLCKILLQVASGQSEQQDAPTNKFVGALDPHCSLWLLVSSRDLAKWVTSHKDFHWA